MLKHNSADSDVEHSEIVWTVLFSLVFVAFFIAVFWLIPSKDKHEAQMNAEVEEYVNNYGHGLSHDYKLETYQSRSKQARGYLCSVDGGKEKPCLKLTSGDKRLYVFYEKRNHKFVNIEIIPDVKRLEVSPAPNN